MDVLVLAAVADIVKVNVASMVGVSVNVSVGVTVLEGVNVGINVEVPVPVAVGVGGGVEVVLLFLIGRQAELIKLSPNMRNKAIAFPILILPPVSIRNTPRQDRYRELIGCSSECQLPARSG
ncbi:MAG TPA: hypothetical protein VMT91_13220 [Anaerolineales bacterium]|nr:hypothetical protein [Anaerolineales bacterium]